MKFSKINLGLCVCFSAMFGMPIPAFADEVRLGVVIQDHNVVITRPQKENSPSLSGEYIFATPKWLEWAASANPYVYGTLNLKGNTNHGGVGLNWRQHVGKFYAEFGTGLTVHDGALAIFGDIDFTLPDDQILAALRQVGDRRAADHQFGSRVLFRNQVALGYKIDEKWGADVYFEHLSHGQILSDGRNDGLDSVGLRVSRKF